MELQERKAQSSSDTSEETGGLVSCFQAAVKIWICIFLRSLPRLSVIILLMWIYYIPSRILTRKLLDQARLFVYVLVRNCMMVVLFSLSFSLYFEHVFGFEYVLKAVIYVVVPCSFVSLSAGVALRHDSFMYNVVMNVISLIGITLSLWLISKSEKSSNCVADDSEAAQAASSNSNANNAVDSRYALTKDGTPFALWKGIMILFMFVNFLVQNLFPVYLSANIYVQLGLRLLVFPLCFTLSKWAQITVLFNFSKQHMDRRLVLNKMRVNYMDLVNRLYLSNISKEGAHSMGFVLVNLITCVFEIVSAVTHIWQLKLSYDIKQRLNKVYMLLFARNGRNQVAAFSSIDSRMDHIERGGGSIPSNNPQSCFCSCFCFCYCCFDFDVTPQNNLDKEEFVRASMEFHEKQICDGICSEIYSIFTAPLLMYFLYTICHGTPLQTIAPFWMCVYQISVQLAFEFVSDVAKLTYQLWKRRITVDLEKKWIPMQGSLLVSFYLFCVVYVHFLVGVFS